MAQHLHTSPDCQRGGKREGCGRKPGIKTHPLRLPCWLLEELSAKGDPQTLIIQACMAAYSIALDNKSNDID